MSRQTLTFVSHTHWDREWYQPFEEFRIRLVQMMDRLLHILDTDSDYKYFMLDGQTIVLDDYLAIRPENEGKIKQYVQEGRIQIGPWHILPDEFLVGPESTVRNLLVGAQTCANFGKRMDVGNIPDPFGHISQLPQLLRGFDMDAAVFWRGISKVKNEFIWRAPDGSEVLVIHQHNGYGNAAGMPAEEHAFVQRVQQLIADLSPTATTPHLLAMNGTDHMEAMPELPRLLAAAGKALPEVDIRHGTLPQFIAEIRADSPQLEAISGELRDCSSAHLLPGVLSARMWIKQRNAACETLLTAWAEPLVALATIADAPVPMRGQSALVRQAWRYLLQNHPHDSICGCSIDQVHKEMAVRFDWMEQIGEQVAAASLGSVATLVNTENEGSRPAIVVFNPTTRPRSDLVSARVPMPEGTAGIVLVTDDGQCITPQVSEQERDVLAEFTMPVSQFKMVASQVPYEIEGAGIQKFRWQADGALLNLEIVLAKGQPPNVDHIRRSQVEIMRALESDAIEQVYLVVHHGDRARCTFVVPDVPGLGYRTCWVQPVNETPARAEKPEAPGIENEFYRIRMDDDGSFTLTDKETGTVYAGLNRFVDVGDRGDEYNFCPVEEDIVVQAAAEKPFICLIENGPARQTLEVSLTYRVPEGLGETRSQRSDEWVDLPITTRISLSPGVRRVDVETRVENNAADHRLRVHFPVPVRVDSFDTEGHFDILNRSLDLPADTEGWAEQPVPTHPQRTWADVSDGRVGLLLANRGLPEVEALRTERGSEVALTLLRCVGWLSRGDLASRRGHAGPGSPTPEAQCPGLHTFHYALVPHTGGWQTVFHQAYAFNAPLRAAVAPAHQGALPASGSFVQIEPASLVVSAIKEAEEGNGLIVRFWNTGIETCEAAVKLWKRPGRAARCNLGERTLEALAVAADGTVHVSARGREIVTLRAEF